MTLGSVNNNLSSIAEGRQLVLDAYNKDRKATQKAVQEFNSAMEKIKKGSEGQKEKFIAEEHNELYAFGKKIAEILGLVYTNDQPCFPIYEKTNAIFDYIARNRDNYNTRKDIDVHPHVKKIMQRIVDNKMVGRDQAKTLKAANPEKAGEKTQNEMAKENQIRYKEAFWSVAEGLNKVTGFHGTLFTYSPPFKMGLPRI